MALNPEPYNPKPLQPFPITQPQLSPHELTQQDAQSGSEAPVADEVGSSSAEVGDSG